jgi:sugar/nucleoside kinase (ribokinase family)
MTGFMGKEAIDPPEFFHVMGCSLMANETFREQIIHAMHAFAAQGSRITFDPNIRAELLRDRSLDEVIGPVMENCAILLPGVSELALISGEKQILRGVERLFDLYPLELIVLKRGKQGCTVYPRFGDVLEVPAYPIEEVDPTGAGDCFDAGFLSGLLDGCSLEDCARMASAAGALNTAAFGPMEGKISREAIWNFIGRHL